MEINTSSNDLLINEAIISNMKKSKEVILFIISIVLATICLLLFALPLVFPKISAEVFSGRQIFAFPIKQK